MTEREQQAEKRSNILEEVASHQQWRILQIPKANHLLLRCSPATSFSSSLIHSLRVQPHSVVNNLKIEGGTSMAARFQDVRLIWPPIALKEGRNISWPGSFQSKSRDFEQPSELHKIDLNLKL